MSVLWWLSYMLLYDLDMFETDYLQAWHDRHAREGPVVWVNIFIGDESMCVPLLFDRSISRIGNDRQTFENLRMWYSLLRVKRGIGEVILPKRLVRIDQVGVSRPSIAIVF